MEGTDIICDNSISSNPCRGKMSPKSPDCQDVWKHSLMIRLLAGKICGN